MWQPRSGLLVVVLKMITRTHFSKFWRVLFFCSFSGNETSPESFLLHNALARKPKRIRTAFSPSQLLRLEHAFEKNHYVVGAERKQLAHSLSLTETQVRDTKCFSHLFIHFTCAQRLFHCCLRCVLGVTTGPPAGHRHFNCWYKMNWSQSGWSCSLYLSPERGTLQHGVFF